MVKVTSSTNDVIPRSLFIDVFDSIGPYILLIINKSCVPSSLKYAVVEPLLKKPGLDLLYFNIFVQSLNFLYCKNPRKYCVSSALFFFSRG